MARTGSARISLPRAVRSSKRSSARPQSSVARSMPSARSTFVALLASPNAVPWPAAAAPLRRFQRRYPWRAGRWPRSSRRSPHRTINDLRRAHRNRRFQFRRDIGDVWARTSSTSGRPQRRSPSGCGASAAPSHWLGWRTCSRRCDGGLPAPPAVAPIDLSSVISRSSGSWR